MAQHLRGCAQNKNGAKSKSRSSAFHIIAESPYDHRYWLHIEADRDAKLIELDDFLRGIWLECCGHMSAFRIKNKGYTAPEAIRETGDRDMYIRLDTILSPGLKFQYEYDFGSTTEVALSVVGIEPSKRDSAVALLARNEPLVFPCTQCGRTATEFCGDECLWAEGPGGSVLCEKCSSKHGCDKDMRMPIVNSPRMGVCGYSG